MGLKLNQLLSGKHTHVKVKTTPFTRRFGVTVINDWNTQNNRAWPGEIGEIKKKTISGIDWSTEVMYIVFSQGRVINLAEQDLDTGKWKLLSLKDAKDFRVLTKKERENGN